MKKYKVGQILNRVKDKLEIEEGQEYKRLTIRMYHKGVCLRDIELGENIGTKNQFVARSGQFIMSRIDARNGAFGIIPESIGHAAITNDFISFTVNEELVDIDFFELYSQTDNFMQLCIEGSKGTTNRKRLKEEVFLEFEVYLPEVEKQIQIVNNVKRLKILNENFASELYFQGKAVQILRNSILHEALQGKLVPQDPNDETARVLLEISKTEKERLVKEKKIKKETALPPILKDEVPYELPKGWEWVRLGDVSTIKGGKRLPAGYTLIDVPTPHIYIRVTDMKNESIDDSDLKYISGEVYEQIKDYIIESRDLYITIVGSTIGKVGIIPEKFNNMNLTENAARIMIHGVDKLFLLNILKSSLLQEQFVDKTNQVGQPKLALIRLKSAVFPLPSINEQNRIVEKIEQLMALCDELENKIEQSKQDIEMVMKSVLQEAFSISKKEDNIIEFPASNLDEEKEEWDMVARADGVSPETQAEIADTLEEIKRERR